MSLARPGEHVAAGSAARAFDEPRAPQAQKDLLQIGDRKVLPLGDRRKRYRAADRFCAPHLARSAIAITAYRALVFNSTPHPPAIGAVRTGFPALSLAFGTRACAKKRDRRKAGLPQTPLFRTVLNSYGEYENSEPTSQGFGAAELTVLPADSAYGRAATPKELEKSMPELIINGPAGRIEARYHHDDGERQPHRAHPASPPAVRRDDEQSGRLHALSHVRGARLLGAALQLPRRRPQPGHLGRRPRRAVGRSFARSTGCRSSSPTPRAAGSPASPSAPGSPCSC